MKKLGECLVFYLKYPKEMEKLYEQETELEGLEDPDGTKRMAKQVGDKSCQEAADFLEEYGRIIEQHFSKIGNQRIPKTGRIEKRAQVEKKWSLSFGVWPANRNRPTGENWRMKAGVDLKEVEAGKFEVIAWLWRVGGEESENFVKFHLKDRIKGTSKDLDDWDEGQVALARIPLSTSEPIECEAILDEVNKAFQQISKQEFEILYP